MIRRTVHFAGRVQGVGFRYTAVSISKSYAVAGYVMNLDDGRVRLVAEGEPDQVEAFVQAVHERMRRHITDTQIEQAEATGEFGDPRDPGSFTVDY